MNKITSYIIESIKHNTNITAIKDDQITLNYYQLGQKVDKFYKKLLENGVRQGDFIVISMEDNVTTIIAILAIVFLDAVFIPIDFELSKEHWETYFFEVKVNWVLCDKKRAIELEKIGFCSKVDYNEEVFLCNRDENVPVNKRSDSMYIYFTSGSTGNPKAILGKRSAVIQFIEWEIKEFELLRSYKYSQLTPIMFDPFLREIFTPLCSGGTICIPNKKVKNRINKLAEWIGTEKINIINVIPTYFQKILDFLPVQNSIRIVFLAGEKLYRNHIIKVYTMGYENIQLVNLYGPSETTLAKFFYRIRKEDLDRESIPVGKSIDNFTYFFLKNDLGQTCKTGEVYISTPYASYGYLNELENPKYFSKNILHSKHTVFKTGDIGKILETGDLDIIGRIDNQIKINGKKFQLEVIEKKFMKLRDIPSIGAVVIEQGGSRLILVCEEEYFIKDHFNDEVRDKLGLMHIPVEYISLNVLPRKSNGKIDRLKLKIICEEKLKRDQVCVYNNIETRILKCIRQTLDNEFIELERHRNINSIFDSLSYIELIVLLEEEFHIEIEDSILKLDYFKNIQELIEYIDMFRKDTIRVLENELSI